MKGTKTDPAVRVADEEEDEDEDLDEEGEDATDAPGGKKKKKKKKRKRMSGRKLKGQLSDKPQDFQVSRPCCLLSCSFLQTEFNFFPWQIDLPVGVKERSKDHAISCTRKETDVLSRL